MAREWLKSTVKSSPTLTKLKSDVKSALGKDKAKLLLESAKKNPLSAQECVDLLDARADINALDGLGVSALMCMAFSGSSDCVRLLLERAAAPEHSNCDGWTTLHYAVKGNQKECARLVLEGGADALAVNNAGETAADLLTRSSSVDCGDWDELLFDAEAAARRRSFRIVAGVHVEVISKFHALTEQHVSQVLERGVQGTTLKVEGKSAIIQFMGYATRHIVSPGKFRNLEIVAEDNALILILHASTAASNGITAIECKNVAGDSLVVLKADSSKTLAAFRCRVQEELSHICALDCGQSVSLMLPSGRLLPRSSDENSLANSLASAQAHSVVQSPDGRQLARDGREGGRCSTICRDLAMPASRVEQLQFDDACLFKVFGIFHEKRSGTFQADSKLVGWKGDDGSVAAYPWNTLKKAEWLAGRMRIQFELKDGGSQVVGFESFLDEDYEKFNAHFESKGGYRIHVHELA